MSVFAQTFFTFVRRHFMSFFLFTVWHSVNVIGLTFLFLHTLHENLSGLESGNIMLGNNEGSVLGNIACSLLGSLFQDEATESAEINILFLH